MTIIQMNKKDNHQENCLNHLYMKVIVFII